VWLSDAIVGGALLFGLTLLSPDSWRARLGLCVGAAAALAAFHALAWPQCLGRLDAVSPEAQRLWLRYVEEVRPFYRQNWRIAVLIAALPITGLFGFGLLAWKRRGDPQQVRRILGIAAPTLAATLLLLWQSRTAPAAQMMATIGCAAFIWLLVPLAGRLRPRLLGIAAAGVAVFVGSGAAMPIAIGLLANPAPNVDDLAAAKANSACSATWTLQQLDGQPKGVVFTFLDLGPRLIKATHHDAIAGPYHRNSDQIVDSMKAFLGSADQAHALVRKYHSTYVLVCPGSWAAQNFLSQGPHGFYAQLDEGRTPLWLKPVELPDGSPFRMWRVVG
jgi:hypothetical protein